MTRPKGRKRPYKCPDKRTKALVLGPAPPSGKSINTLGVSGWVHKRKRENGLSSGVGTESDTDRPHSQGWWEKRSDAAERPRQVAWSLKEVPGALDRGCPWPGQELSQRFMGEGAGD